LPFRMADHGVRNKATKLKPQVDAIEETPPPPMKKKKGKEGEKDVVSAPAVVEEIVPTESEGQARKNRKRRLEAVPADDEERAKPTPVSDDERRHAQRAIQQLVVKMRAEGKSDWDIDAAKLRLKKSFGFLRQPEGTRAKKSEAWKKTWDDESVKDTRKENSEKVHELVVIPVVWRGRHDREDVDEMAEKIKQVVAQQGVDVWVDSRRHYTPGQKFAHWEHRGTMLRVEVGPDDVDQGVCRVCCAKVPGEYKTVERKKVPLPPAGSRALLLALKGFGLDKIEVEKREGDSEAEEDPEGCGQRQKMEASRKAIGGSVNQQEDGEVAGNWAPRQKEKAEKEKGTKKKKPKTS